MAGKSGKSNNTVLYGVLGLVVVAGILWFTMGGSPDEPVNTTPVSNAPSNNAQPTTTAMEEPENQYGEESGRLEAESTTEEEVAESSYESHGSKRRRRGRDRKKVEEQEEEVEEGEEEASMPAAY